MSLTKSPPADAPPGTRPPVPRLSGPLMAVLLLAAVLVLSLAVGARQLSLGEVWHGLVDPRSATSTVVRQLRLPRTLLGLLAGTALGLAGGVAQALTRNPLADPGLLGINAGAASAVVSRPRSSA